MYDTDKDHYMSIDGNVKGIKGNISDTDLESAHFSEYNMQ